MPARWVLGLTASPLPRRFSGLAERVFVLMKLLRDIEFKSLTWRMWFKMLKPFPVQKLKGENVPVTWFKKKKTIWEVVYLVFHFGKWLIIPERSVPWLFLKCFEVIDCLNTICRADFEHNAEQRWPQKEKGEINFQHLNWKHYKIWATNTILSFSDN